MNNYNGIYNSNNIKQLNFPFFTINTNNNHFINNSFKNGNPNLLFNKQKNNNNNVNRIQINEDNFKIFNLNNGLFNFPIQ